MIKSLFIKILTSFLFAVFFGHLLQGQDWENFLERHIDNLHNADERPERDAQYSDETLLQRKDEVLMNSYNSNKNLFNAPTGHANPNLYGRNDIFKKNETNAILATIVKGDSTHAQNARNMLYNTMLTWGENSGGAGRMFVSYVVAYILNKYPEVISGDKEVDLKNFYSENFGNLWGRFLWSFSTENHCQMFRSTTYGIGLRWPDSTFIVRQDNSRENGLYMSNQIEEKHITKYMPYLYKYGMAENLSPVYIGAHINPWSVFYELSRLYDRQVPMQVSSAVLEYYNALGALNSQHNMYTGTVSRVDPESVNGSFGRGLIHKQLGWFPPGQSASGTTILASTNYLPEMPTRRFVAGDIRMPYSFMQTTALKRWYVHHVPIEDRGVSFDPIHPSYAKAIFRYNYVHRYFSLGTGNVKVLPGDIPDYEDGIAGSASWDNGFMIFSSPQVHNTSNWGDKFFRQRKPGYSGQVGEESWPGYSPYLEMAQFNNMAVIYNVIPVTEPHRITQVYISSPGAGESLEKDDVRRAYYGMYQAKEGQVYIAFIPLHYTGNNLRESGFHNIVRLVDDGSGDDGHCGYVLEMAHSSEIGFEEFKNRSNGARLSWNKDAAKVSYTGMKGDQLSLQHSSRTSRNDKLPTIEITPFTESTVSVDWENYPTIRSPYMKILEEDGRAKMVINDNESGVKIDFDGEAVHYTEFNDFVPLNFEYDTIPSLNHYDIQLGVLNLFTEEPVKGLEVIVNNVSYFTNDEGIIALPGIAEGFHSLALNHENYEFSGPSVIEVRSDSLINVLVAMVAEVSVNVANKTTGSPVFRAVVHARQTDFLTNSQGMATLGKNPSGNFPVSVSHIDFFDFADTLMIKGDTILKLALTPRRANITMEVHGTDGPLGGAIINMGFSMLTDSHGKAFFFNQPARETYHFTVERLGYVALQDSFYLEVDTTLQIVLDKTTSTFGPGFGDILVSPVPFDDHINIEMPAEGLLYLYDVSGRFKFSTALQEGRNTIPSVDFGRGGYILRIVSGEKVYNKLVFK